MINKNTISEYLHSACLGRFIYFLNKKKIYDKKDTFIDNVKEIIRFNSKTYKILENLFPDDKFIKFISSSETGLDVLITINEKLKKIYITFRGTEIETILKKIYITFRGTEIETLYNLIFTPKFLDNGIYVHRGYWAHLTNNNLHLAMCDIIKDLLDTHPDYKIITIGHSLASTLGLLFSYILINNIPSLVGRIKVNMFAPPSACNKKMFTFLKSKNIEISSFVYKNDFVTSLFPGYYEYFPKYVLSDNFYYYLTGTCNNTFESNKEDFGNNRVGDHNSKNYLNSLLAIYCKYEI